MVRDAGTFRVPFPSGVVSGDPELDSTANYYTTLQERRTFTTNLINVFRFSFVRTQNYGNSAGTLGGILNEFSDRNADEDIAVTGITTIGTAAPGSDDRSPKQIPGRRPSVLDARGARCAHRGYD